MRFSTMLAAAGLLCGAAGAAGAAAATEKAAEAAAAIGQPAAAAAIEQPAGAAATSGWQPVGDAVLAEARGGFDVGGGLMLSLGIERVVSLNGNVVSSSSFNIPDVARLSAEQAGQVSAALSSINLVQNGDGNHFAAPALPQALGATVIQNSLNDQVLATRTVINTSVNSLEFFKAINFLDGLRSALSDAIGAR